jgi:hypothetical protein
MPKKSENKVHDKPKQKYVIPDQLSFFRSLAKLTFPALPPAIIRLISGHKGCQSVERRFVPLPLPPTLAMQILYLHD